MGVLDPVKIGLLLINPLENWTYVSEITLKSEFRTHELPFQVKL